MVKHKLLFTSVAATLLSVAILNSQTSNSVSAAEVAEPQITQQAAVSESTVTAPQISEASQASTSTAESTVDQDTSGQSNALQTEQTATTDNNSVNDNLSNTDAVNSNNSASEGVIKVEPANASQNQVVKYYADDNSYLANNQQTYYLLDNGFSNAEFSTSSYRDSYHLSSRAEQEGQIYYLVNIDNSPVFWVKDNALSSVEVKQENVKLENKIGVISYLQGYGAAVWRDAGQNGTTGTYLPNGSAWQLANYRDQDNQRWYQVGLDEWVSGQYLTIADTTKTSSYLDTPWISQYAPVFAPWGCASAAMAMLLQNAGVANTGSYAWLKNAQDNLPMYPTYADGQKGNVYTGEGFGWVINANGLTEFGKRYSSKVVNISGANADTIASLVKSNHAVLYYGYSSYDAVGPRNHCKVIVGFSPSLGFAVQDPLYYPNKMAAGQGGHNRWDMGAIHWESLDTFNQEYNGSAITIQ